MIVGKIRVENFRGMSLGIYDENNRLHATAVTERADLQAICDGYNAFVDLSAVDANTATSEPAIERDAIENALWQHQHGLIDTVERNRIVFEQLGLTTPPAGEPRRGRGRPRKEVTEGGV